MVVSVKNLGTRPGTVTVSLMEDLGGTRSWLSHGSVELSLTPKQTLESIPLLFETYGAGPQNLYVNITGMDIWIENSNLPNCYSINNSASCDLDVENDMPRVISQEDLESGLSGTTMIVSILALLLLGAGVAILVLLRRDNSEQSIFYDDDEWEDDEDVEEQKVQPILPPLAPNKTDLDAASKALELKQEEVADEAEPDQNMSSDSKSEKEEAVDPWADITHDSEE